MLPDYKRRWFERLFVGHVHRRLGRTFGEVRIDGLAAARAAVGARPVLGVVNHTAFWDGLIIIWLSQRMLRADGYAWMDGDNLARLPFFRWVGAFGVRPNSAADAARGMRHAVSLLQRAGRWVWIFPQGREVPITTRPVRVRRGSQHLARRVPGAAVVPVALRYEFGAAERPCVHVRFGAPLAADADHGAALTELLGQQDVDVVDRTASARTVVVPLSWPSPIMTWLTRVLAALAHRFHTP